mgnify:CR=1 FL=1
MPTAAPSQLPSLGPTISAAPTRLPLPSPTGARLVLDPVLLSLSNIECASYDAQAELVVNTAVVSFIDGAESNNVGDHSCEDQARRRRRLTAAGGVEIMFTISVDTAQHDDSENVQESIEATLAQAASSGALQQAIIVAATAANVTAMTKVTVQSIGLIDAAQPAAAPRKEGLSRSAAIAVAFGSLILAAVSVAAIFMCRKNKPSRGSVHAADPDECGTTRRSRTTPRRRRPSQGWLQIQ